MIKDIQALENYFVERVGTIISQEELEFMRSKLTRVKDHINELDVKVKTAEEKEKLGIEKQKTFGSSQTQVEVARHENIMEELKFMGEKGITNYNRSSYPQFARHQGKYFKPNLPNIKKKTHQTCPAP